MKKNLIICLALLTLMVPSVFASTGGAISATAAEAKTQLSNSNHVFVINDGANEVFIELKAKGQQSEAAATVSSFELVSTESMTFDSRRGFEYVSTICSSGETASVRYIAWE